MRNLTDTLTGFSDQRSRHFAESPRSQGTVTLGIHGTDDCVRLHYDGEALSINRYDADPAVGLDRWELVLLLFGNRAYMPGVRNRHPLLAAICPLRCYLWPSERV